MGCGAMTVADLQQPRDPTPEERNKITEKCKAACMSFILDYCRQKIPSLVEEQIHLWSDFVSETKWEEEDQERADKEGDAEDEARLKKTDSQFAGVEDEIHQV